MGDSTRERHAEATREDLLAEIARLDVRVRELSAQRADTTWRLEPATQPVGRPTFIVNDRGEGGRG